MILILLYKIVCLEQLSWLKTMALINMNMQVIELDLIENEPSHIQVEELVKCNDF